jgi:hypothetical protein
MRSGAWLIVGADSTRRTRQIADEDWRPSFPEPRGTLDAPPPAMKGMAFSLGIAVALIIVVWLVGQAAGFQVSLVGSLVLTIGLTLVLNLVLGAFRGRRRGTRTWTPP